MLSVTIRWSLGDGEVSRYEYRLRHVTTFNLKFFGGIEQASVASDISHYTNNYLGGFQEVLFKNRWVAAVCSAWVPLHRQRLHQELGVFSCSKKFSTTSFSFSKWLAGVGTKPKLEIFSFFCFFEFMNDWLRYFMIQVRHQQQWLKFRHVLNRFF